MNNRKWRTLILYACLVCLLGMLYLVWLDLSMFVNGVEISGSGCYQVGGRKYNYDEAGFSFFQKWCGTNTLLMHVGRNVQIRDLIAAKEWFESNGVLEFKLDVGCARRFRLIGMACGLHRIRVGSARMAGSFVVLPSGIEYVESEGDVFPSVENGKTLRGGTKTEMKDSLTGVLSKLPRSDGDKVFMLVCNREAIVADVVSLLDAINDVVGDVYYMITIQ